MITARFKRKRVRRIKAIAKTANAGPVLGKWLDALEAMLEVIVDDMELGADTPAAIAERDNLQHNNVILKKELGELAA